MAKFYQRIAEQQGYLLILGSVYVHLVGLNSLRFNSVACFTGEMFVSELVRNWSIRFDFLCIGWPPIVYWN